MKRNLSFNRIRHLRLEVAYLLYWAVQNWNVIDKELTGYMSEEKIIDVLNFSSTRVSVEQRDEEDGKEFCNKRCWTCNKYDCKKFH